VNKCTAGALERTAAFAFFDPNNTVSNPAHLSVEQTPKRSRVPDADAGYLDCALAEVGRKERKGLPGIFGFVGFSCLALHRDMSKFTGIFCRLGTGDRSRVSAPMPLMDRVAEATTSQPKTLPKTQSFAVQLTVHSWLTLHVCISFPAIRQTLAVRMMLRVIARELSRKIGIRPDE
jgi:hypothetical protein